LFDNLLASGEVASLLTLSLRAANLATFATCSCRDDAYLSSQIGLLGPTMYVLESASELRGAVLIQTRKLMSVTHAQQT
jgi:hypothetical protein